MNDSDSLAHRLENLLQEGDKEGALRLLCDLVAAHARNKNFLEAEKFRDRLYDIDAMALSEIIKANEIIAEEKSKGLNHHHKEIWARLYGSLTTNEGIALHAAIEEKTVLADEFVFRHGEPCSSLYLVNHGRVRIISKQGTRELLISILGPGSIFGVDTFFFDSFCSTSATALSTVRLGRLERNALTHLQRHHPGLPEKLKNYCLEGDSIHDLLQKKGMDRRVEIRKGLTGEALVQFLGNAEEPIGKAFSARLFDISSGGISFLLKIANAEKARIMLGRRLLLQLGLNTVEKPLKIQNKGTIVAINPKPNHDFSFHIKFDTGLSKKELESVLNVFSENSLTLEMKDKVNP